MLKLISCAELPPGAVQCVTLDTGSHQISVIVLNEGGEFHAYLNSCPHIGVGLHWRPDSFRDLSGQYLQCGTHGALFEPASGHCVDGPCTGERLIRVDITIEKGVIYATTPDKIPLSAREQTIPLPGAAPQ